MSIVFDKLIEVLKSRGITSYTIRKENIISQSALTKIKKNGNIDMQTLNRLCSYLNCQPGDILEYVEEEIE